MTLNEYQKEAMTTATFGAGEKLVYPILGLVGEAGELANKYKKVLRDDSGVLSPAVREALKAELGDVLWYVAAVAKDLDTSLEIIAEDNIIKLKDRHSRGVVGGSGDNR